MHEKNTEPVPDAKQGKGGSPLAPRRLKLLPLGVRITLLALGWIVVLIGVAGLLLPGLQGIVTIVIGAAVLSVASERVYTWLRRRLHRWPRVSQRLERLRHTLHSKLSRKKD